MEWPSQLTRVEGESTLQHAAFLLWAMQDPALRSPVLVSKGLPVATQTVYNWSSRKGWKPRLGENIGDPKLSQGAADMYASLYQGEYGIEPVKCVMPKMAVKYQAPQARAEGIAQEALDQSLRTDDETDARKQRLMLILDAAEVQLAKKLIPEEGSGGRPELQVGMADLPRIVNARKAMGELYGNPRQADLEHAKGPVGASMDRSERVIQAQERKDGTVLDAMRADTVELLRILDVLGADESVERTNLIPFRGRAEQAE